MQFLQTGRLLPDGVIRIEGRFSDGTDFCVVDGIQGTVGVIPDGNARARLLFTDDARVGAGLRLDYIIDVGKQGIVPLRFADIFNVSHGNIGFTAGNGEAADLFGAA